jgi:N-methylhydantoinase B
MKDGIEGMDFAVGHFRNIPAETVEAEMPILIERYGLRADSAGPGKYRGGSGIDLKVRILSPDTVMTARNMERMQFQPWGRLGGGVGQHGEAILNAGQAEERSLGRIDELLLQPGDTVTFLSQGGGGYGDPYGRDEEDVLKDIRSSLLTVEHAREFYGVALKGTLLDEESTKLLRSGHIESHEAFSFGEARERFEKIWTDEMQRAVGQALRNYPLALRDYLKRQTMSEAERAIQSGEDIQPANIPVLMETLRGKIGLS